MTTIATLVAKLEADTRQFERSMKTAEGRLDDLEGTTRRADAATGGLGAKFGGLATKAVLVGGAVAGVAAVGYSAIQSFSNLEESVNAVNVQFGDGADTILSFGETAAESVGMSNSAFNQLSVVTGATLSAFIDDEQQVADATVELTQRATDMASVFNTDVDEALVALQSAIRGEMEPIRRFGVSLDDATIRAHAVEMGLAATTAEVTIQQKQMAALELIYAQTDKTAGDFANTSDSLANRQRSLSASFEDAKASVGEALAPAMESMLTVVEDLVPVLEDLGPAFASLATGIAGVIEVLKPAIGLFIDFIDLAGRGASHLAEAFGSETAAQANRWAEAVEHITDAVARGQDPAAAYADAINHLSITGDITADQINKLGNSVEFAGEQQAVAVGEVLKLAQANDRSEDDIRALEEAFVDQAAALELPIDTIEDLIREYGLSKDAADRLRESTSTLSAEHHASVGAQRVAAQAAAQWEEAQRQAGEAAGTAADETDTQREAVIKLAQEQGAAADPVLNLIQRNRDYQNALSELRVAEGDSETSAADLHLANEKVLETYGALVAAKGPYQSAMGENTQAFIDQAREAGWNEQAISDYIDILNQIPANITTTYDFITRVSGDPLPGAAGVITPPGVAIHHDGGFVEGPPGADVPIIAEAGEYILSKDMVNDLMSGGISDLMRHRPRRLLSIDLDDWYDDLLPEPKIDLDDWYDDLLPEPKIDLDDWYDDLFPDPPVYPPVIPPGITPVTPFPVPVPVAPFEPDPSTPGTPEPSIPHLPSPPDVSIIVQGTLLMENDLRKLIDEAIAEYLRRAGMG